MVTVSSTVPLRPLPESCTLAAKSPVTVSDDSPAATSVDAAGSASATVAPHWRTLTARSASGACRRRSCASRALKLAAPTTVLRSVVLLTSPTASVVTPPAKLARPLRSAVASLASPKAAVTSMPVSETRPLPPTVVSVSTLAALVPVTVSR